MSFPSFFTLLLHFFFISASGFGSMGPISAAFGENGFFCAIDASGKQEVICWTKNTTLPSTPPSTSSAYFSDIPAMAALSGGEGFLCGILANSSQAFCWSSGGLDLVPSVYRNTAYSHIAAGKNHVCAIRGSYYSSHDSGSVDCWKIVKGGNNSLTSVQSSNFYDQSVGNLVFSKVASGEGFSCGRVRDGGVVCWGPNSASLGVSKVSGNYVALASGVSALCGILEESNEVDCWGSSNDSFSSSPVGTRFVSLTAGANHFCGIREDNHAIECWGSFNLSSVPKGGYGFMAIASSDFTTCGIRENDLVIDCWFTNGTSPPEYNPPLELCSPGLCGPGPCSDGEFVFNASILNEPDLTSLCVRKDLNICSQCGSNCSQGFFLSSPCNENADRVCTDCSLCQNSSCRDVCGIQSSAKKKQWFHFSTFHILIILGCFVLVILFILFCCFIRCCLIATRKEEGSKKQFTSCIGKSELETDNASDLYQPPSTAPCPGVAQVFRLSELKDATNGFKEFNELGRGSYGFVYKAVLVDGTPVAVKRANAATIIHSNSRDFEMELEVLCNARHSNIVNLLGYCSEMGERLLVYEYMPHGTLHDHLHNELSPLNWSLRLRISLQAAKGLEYLHKEAEPPIVHGNVKTSNILLDADWGARIADFGLITSNDKDCCGDMKTDVYDFGIILLEILTGRKKYDRDYTPPSIVEWAVPLIKQGKAAAVIDQDATLPKNFEPLLKLVEIANLAVKEDPKDRPTMSDLATWLEQIVKDAL
ncbi:serine/threonine-protein kinase-like protein CCR1 [Mercurialis annua]|uniref:serine/threonine-protein kinase-like protein CCR1 n=1 Tax=Mercurialis annua TaxID=3986 RepID=UPI00215FEDB3|nr:serine/threonine-protein kinase-like protein CCR1 [Mercurialis annua]